MNRRTILGLAVAVFAGVLPAGAHHSISGVYDSSRQVTVDGTVTEFQFVNPHPFVIIAVPDSDRRMQSWRLEMDNRSELSAIGVTAETLKPGDRVVVIGSAGREQPRSLYVRTLDRPSDGFRYEQVGNSPRIRPGSR